MGSWVEMGGRVRRWGWGEEEDFGGMEELIGEKLEGKKEKKCFYKS
jgi:hypothetical protein